MLIVFNENSDFFFKKNWISKKFNNGFQKQFQESTYVKDSIAFLSILNQQTCCSVINVHHYIGVLYNISNLECTLQINILR